MLELHERVPVRVGKYVGFAKQQKLHNHAHGVGQDIRVELAEDLAFVFVVMFPCLGLAGL